MENNQNEDFRNGLNAIGEILKHVAQGISDFVEENNDKIKELQYYFENFEEINSGLWARAAEKGWFPNDFIPSDFWEHVDKDRDSFDAFMSKEIENSIDDIHQQLAELYPARKAIFDVAFELHKENNYIAAIPLFLSQTDGIFAQSLGSYLFSERDKRIMKIQELIEAKPEMAIILAPLLQDTEFGARISNAKRTHKDKAPNRNGILHGSRKHLDYATNLNSLKCISLLAYVATIFTEGQ
ncbi:hypothetical protein [Vibrio sp. 2-2(8)]|uniref:hypothetical protein n=1 Tax=Vibrio sp. 2-2(8) TaxID=2591014 RepID=UPI00148214BF|nr:hypothetical protein [Vibrio sp. 2-2(8)]NNN49824.1 hypothetical protein [Vibrio sp. 2-2(8)]